MTKRSALGFIILFALLLTGIFMNPVLRRNTQPQASRTVFSHTIVRYGDSGSDVNELQGRLKHLGYYQGKINGKYNYSTLQAVKSFQHKFGMKVDGIVGSKTKLKLWRASKSWSPGSKSSSSSGSSSSGASSKTSASLPGHSYSGLSSKDIKLMANAVYGESRGEPFTGQIAVAAVIMNRVKSPNFPNTVSGVIFQPGAFTAVSDGQIWLTPNAKAKKAVIDALHGMDPTGGCIYYFNPATATSKWIWSRPQSKRIGKHIFCH